MEGRKGMRINYLLLRDAARRKGRYLAKSVGVHPVTMSKWLNPKPDQKQHMSFETLDRICELLGEDTDRFVEFYEVEASEKGDRQAQQEGRAGNAFQRVGMCLSGRDKRKD